MPLILQSSRAWSWQKNTKTSRVSFPGPLKMEKTSHQIQDGGAVDFSQVHYGIFLNIAKIKMY
ncbi:hypothetical protein D3C78_1465810 [compost metagenome]